MNMAGWRWVPVFDANTLGKDSEHSFWPLFAKGARFNFILLNGIKRPAVVPQPVPTTKPLRLPIIGSEKRDKDSETKNENARNFLWESMRLADLDVQKLELETQGRLPDDVDTPEQMEAKFLSAQLDADKFALKLMQDACKAGDIARACDLGFRLKTDKCLAIGVTIANTFSQPKLAEKLEIEYQRREQQRQEAMQQFEQAQYGGDDGRGHDNAGDDEDVFGHGEDENLDSTASTGVSLSHRARAGESDSYMPPVKAVPVNPFAIKSPLKSSPAANSQSPLFGNKKRSLLGSGGYEESKNSPSPKKPVLSVSSDVSLAITPFRSIGVFSTIY